MITIKNDLCNPMNIYFQDNEISYQVESSLVDKWVGESYDDNNLNSKNKILVKLDEKFHSSNEFIDKVLEKNKLISSVNTEINNPNYYFDPLLNLYYFYFLFGFNHLSYNQLDVRKTNLVGCYHLFNYKKDRDTCHNLIDEHLIEDIHIYNTKKYSKNINNTTKLVYTFEGKRQWNTNHIDGYSDYITSVVGLIHDSMGFDTIEQEQCYLNEKALKGILFSKLNIPFILNTTPKNFKSLKETGFWFLNSEFTDYDVKDGIFKTISFLNDLHQQTGDYQETHNKLVDMFGEKMQNNYKLFHQYLEKPYNHDKFSKFISNNKTS